MKRVSSVLLVAIFLLAAATCSLGAVQSIGGDFISMADGSYMINNYVPRSIDTWFTVTPKNKQIKLMGGSIENVGSGFTAEYYLNDQTFASLGYLNDETGLIYDLTMVKGSYLFGFGLFVGLEYYSDENDYTYYWLAPGYRFSFGDDSYIALSVDYTDMNSTDAEVWGYEAAGKYFTESMKLYGQLLFVENEYTFYNFGANFLVSDAIVIGLGYYGAGDSYDDFVGFTWTTERFILDLIYGNNEDDDNYYELGGMFMINEAFGIGLGYLSESWKDDAQLSAKFKYVTDNSEFGLVYKPKNDSYDQEYYLTYTMKL